MIDTTTILKLNKYENQILHIIENLDSYTQSDLQGAIQAIVLNIYRDGQTNQEAK